MAYPAPCSFSSPASATASHSRACTRFRSTATATWFRLWRPAVVWMSPGRSSSRPASVGRLPAACDLSSREGAQAALSLLADKARAGKPDRATALKIAAIMGIDLDN